MEKNEALQRALQTIETESIRYRHLQHKPWLDDDGNTIWPWQRFLTEGVTLGMSVGMYPDVPSESPKGDSKMKSRRKNVTW